MSKCWNCGLTLRDPEQVCPLCKCIVESDSDEQKMRTYPFLYAEKGIKKMQFALNIYLFAAIVAEVILIGATVFMKGGPMWPILIAVFLVYGYITLKVSIQMSTGHRLKMVLQTYLGVAVLLAIDVLTGFYGWSLNYILPAAFILMAIAILILMVANERNWQSYIPMQIQLIVLCIIPFVLYRFGIVTHLMLPIIAMGVAIIAFLGTIVVGGKRARTELYRRFHV